MTPSFQTEDDIIDLDAYSNEQAANELEGVVDLNDYSNSEEAKEADWWDVAKDVIVQPALGLASAFTWPADVLKIGMMGEGLSEIDELEEAFKKEGKPFDRSEYIRQVADTSQFVPTQHLLENLIEEKSGISLQPKSETGKNIRKFFQLLGLAKGKGAAKAVTSAGLGTATRAGLVSAGANETVADIGADVTSAVAHATEKVPRIFDPAIQKLENIATKHNLPFPEYLTRTKEELINPWVSESRRVSAEKELGKSSEEAINEVIEGTNSAARLRKQGADLDVLVNDAYDEVGRLASRDKNPVNVDQVIKDIDTEIARIKANAPSASEAERSAIKVLEYEKGELAKNPANAEQLVQQIKNYNRNVSGIYKKAEFSGVEDEVRGAYAFLNNSIRNTIESQSGSDVRNAMRAADSLFTEKSKLDKVENLISKAFSNGEYNPKKLSQQLNSKQGLIVRRELGDQAVNEIRDIAKYGEDAMKATAQLAKSSRNLGNVAEWGPIAGFLLHKMPKSAGILLAARPIANRVRGYLLMRPATREVYANIVKNAANGSFKNMAADFGKLEAEVSKDFGSVDEFFKAMEEDTDFFYEGD